MSRDAKGAQVCGAAKNLSLARLTSLRKWVQISTKQGEPAFLCVLVGTSKYLTRFGLLIFSESKP
jgi:hypothetical protein